MLCGDWFDYVWLCFWVLASRHVGTGPRCRFKEGPQEGPEIYWVEGVKALVASTSWRAPELQMNRRQRYAEVIDEYRWYDDIWGMNRYDMTWIQREGCLEFRSSESALELQWIKDVLRFSHWADPPSWCMSLRKPESHSHGGWEMLGRCWGDAGGDAGSCIEVARFPSFSDIQRKSNMGRNWTTRWGRQDAPNSATDDGFAATWRGIISEDVGKMAIWCNLWTSQKLNKIW